MEPATEVEERVGKKERPLILVTNDDGITSDGLWAAARALLPLGDLLVAAPNRQWSGAGRSMPNMVSGHIEKVERQLEGREIEAYAIDASPALVVVHALLELAPRPPALVVSGINFGENISISVTISGTVGAALEGAASGLPAMAVSLAMPIANHLDGGDNTDYRGAMAYTYRFARFLLRYPRPYDVDLLNINLPLSATPETPWRLTRLARTRYFVPTPPNRAAGEGRPGYRAIDDPRSMVAPDTDVWAVAVDEVVSVTPLSLDLTSRSDFGQVEAWLHRLEEEG